MNDILFIIVILYINNRWYLILILSTLLRNYFLYNSVIWIGESALLSLNFIINLSKFITLKTIDAGTKFSEMASKVVENIFNEMGYSSSSKNTDGSE